MGFLVAYIMSSAKYESLYEKCNKYALDDEYMKFIYLNCGMKK